MHPQAQLLSGGSIELSPAHTQQAVLFLAPSHTENPAQSQSLGAARMRETWDEQAGWPLRWGEGRQ